MLDDSEPPTDALERRRWQNRVSQRNHRMCFSLVQLLPFAFVSNDTRTGQKLKARIASLEKKLSSQELHDIAETSDTNSTALQCNGPGDGTTDSQDEFLGPDFDMPSIPLDYHQHGVQSARVMGEVCSTCKGTGFVMNGVMDQNQMTRRQLPQFGSNGHEDCAFISTNSKDTDEMLDPFHTGASLPSPPGSHFNSVLPTPADTIVSPNSSYMELDTVNTSKYTQLFS
jgi:hypothetical protein